MANALEESLPKAIAVVLLALGLVFSAFALLISSLFVLTYWHAYWVFPEEGWQAPLFLTGLWFACAGALAICALVAFSRRSPLPLLIAAAVLIGGSIAVASSYIEPPKPDGTLLDTSTATG
jgi:hypothetical protein